MNFSEALEWVKTGSKIFRKGWTAGYYVRIHLPNAQSEMTAPYLFLFTISTGSSVPWVPGHIDILSEDWAIYEEPAPSIPFGETGMKKSEKVQLFAFQNTRRSKDIIYKKVDYGENGHYKRVPGQDLAVEMSS